MKIVLSSVVPPHVAGFSPAIDSLRTHAIPDPAGGEWFLQRGSCGPVGFVTRRRAEPVGLQYHDWH